MQPAVALYQKENPIFGASRLGVYTRAVGLKPNVIPAKTSYEITDHLGNVRAVIQENLNLFSILLSYADYYAFGEQLPSRNTTSDYRYAFQGQELDKETGMEAFQLRLWDGRIGRWLSPDPYHEFHSPYVGMGNNPVSNIDPDGGCTKCPKVAKAGDTFNHSEAGTLTYKEFKNGGEWLTSGGNIYLDDVSVGKFYTGADLTLIAGLSNTANKLYGSSFNPSVLMNLSETQKRADFQNSASKTVAILMYEFASGTGPSSPRTFGENSAIAKNIKWSYSSEKAMKAFYNTKNVIDGKWYRFYSSFSPDKTGLINSMTSHLRATRDMTIYFGGMVYYMQKKHNKIHFLIKDEYSTASGISRNPNAPTSINSMPFSIRNTYILNR